MNRPDHLIRLIRYYRAVDFDGQILIGDASAAPQSDKLRDAISSLQAEGWARYFHLPGMSIVAALKKLSAKVDTPFAAFCGDDDVLIPSGIRESIKLLQSDPISVASNGRAYVFEIEGNALHGKLKIRERYPMTHSTSVRAVDRLSKHMARYSVSLFSIHRTELWQRMWDCVDENGEFSFMNEVLPCCMSVVSGTIRTTSFVYALRQDHSKRVVPPNAKAWIEDPRWQTSFEYFKRVLVEEIVARDSTSRSDAGAAVDAAMSAYLKMFRGLMPQSIPASRLLRSYRSARTHTAGAIRNRRLLAELRTAASLQADVGAFLKHVESTP